MSDSLFTLHNFEIIVKELNKPIYIIPFGDVHRYAHLCDTEKWLEFLEWAKHKPNAYFLGMGDYDDFVSSSERKILCGVDLHDETRITIDDIFKSRVNNFYEEIKFMKGRLIGLIEGNHYGSMQSGITTTQMLCDKLKCKYLGGNCFIGMSFPYGKKSSSIDIWAHHGRGSSRLVGGSLNTVQQMIDNADADIYLMGHDHKKSIATKNKFRLNRGYGKLSLGHKKILLARTGAFLKGYVPGEPSYIVKSGLSPTDMGTIKIELTPKRDYKDNRERYYIDLHASL